MKNKFLFISISLIVGLLPINKLFAQENARCGNVQAQERLLQEHPELASKIAATELEMSQTPNKSKTTRSPIIIPVVFHIIHDDGPENISDAQVIDAIKRINDDYNLLNADNVNTIPAFDSLKANCGFTFKLATKDPQGNCTNGIDRIRSYKTYFADDKSKINPWNPKHYLNIWVVRTLGTDGNVAAYAYKPATANFIPQYDGIISLYNYVGAIGASNSVNQHTLSHEIGHYFNLDHTWGSTNNPTIACGDDGVSDTPITKGHDNCNNLQSSFCALPIVENVQNFMEYSYCSTMFTIGQKFRMIETLNSTIAERKYLYSDAGLAYTGALLTTPACAPHADFKLAKPFTCVGIPVNLTSTSWGATGINHVWSSPDGSFSTPNANTTTVTFTTPGWKVITLTASNTIGTDSKSMTNAIYVEDPTAQGDATQTETFNQESNRIKWKFYNKFNNYFKFEFNDAVGLWGGNSIMFRAYDERTVLEKQTQTVGGDVDELYTPSYDLTSNSSNAKYLNFYLANAALQGYVVDDTLSVYYSKDCGVSWSLLKNYIGPELHTDGVSYSKYIPENETHWKAKNIQLPNLAITSNTIFKLRFKSSNKSNNLYLDNFLFSTFPTSSSNVSPLNNLFSVFPNPATDNFTVKFSEKINENLILKLCDQLGKIVFTTKINPSTIASNQITIESKNLSNGMYILKIEGKESTKNEKIMIQK